MRGPENLGSFKEFIKEESRKMSQEAMQRQDEVEAMDSLMLR